MEPEGSLPQSQVPATCLYPEPARSSPYPHIPLSWISILILSSHLCLDLPSGLFSSGIPLRTRTNILCLITIFALILLLTIGVLSQLRKPENWDDLLRFFNKLLNGMTTFLRIRFPHIFVSYNFLCLAVIFNQLPKNVGVWYFPCSPSRHATCTVRCSHGFCFVFCHNIMLRVCVDGLTIFWG